MEKSIVFSEFFNSVSCYVDFSRRVRSINRHAQSDADRLFLKSLLAFAEARCKVLIIREKGEFYRAQKGSRFGWSDDGSGSFGHHGLPEDRMTPMTGAATSGRANSIGIPALYMASTKDVALHEVRPWVGSLVSIGICTPVRNLKCIDLRLANESHIPTLEDYFYDHTAKWSAEKINGAVWADVGDAFRTPVTDDGLNAGYAPTQVIADYIKSAGYDGIVYSSKFGDTNSYNVVVFDVAGVSCTCGKPYEVTGVQMSYNPVGDQTEQ